MPPKRQRGGKERAEKATFSSEKALESGRPAVLYAWVLDPQPDDVIPAGLKKEALLLVCPRATAEQAGKVLSDGQVSLLDALRRLEALQGQSPPPPKRSRTAARSGSKAADRLSKLLTEVAARSAQQVEHENALENAAEEGRVKAEALVAATAEARKAKRRGRLPEPTSTCSACLDTLPVAALVVCPFFVEFAECEGNRVVAAKKEFAAHQICPVCLRAYLLAVRLHGGDALSMVCPGCVSSVQHLVGPEHHGQSLRQLSRKKWVGAKGPYPEQTVRRVLGPLDWLRMKDLQVVLKHPPPLSPETVSYLRSEGGRLCPWCKTPHVKGSGCDAVMCELCSTVFDYQRAPKV
eukprot:Hpha_TRINITY_DN20961_c0_g1::TRINITY_DN20961_c0_g1_i1::g.139728::m.139728